MTSFPFRRKRRTALESTSPQIDFAAKGLPRTHEPATDARLLARFFVQHEVSPDQSAHQECRRAFAGLLNSSLLPPRKACTPVKPGPARNVPATVRSAVFDPRAPLDSIRQVKTLAKKLAADDARKVPREVALALYYLSIGVAQLRHDARTTTLPISVLHVGVQWAEQLPWLDRPTRTLLQRCLRAVRTLMEHGEP
jgi:hypothetical protein